MIPSQFAQHVIAENRHWWFVARADILSSVIAEILPADGSKRIVDVGCGTGGMCASLSGNYNVTGFDTSEDAIKVAHSSYEGASFYSYKTPEELRESLGQADLVLMLDVLEHIEDDCGFLSDIVSMIPDGAQILLTVPAMMALWGSQDDVVGHHRRYESKSLQQTWKNMPVDCLWCSYYNARLYIPILIARTVSRWFGISFGKDGMDYAIPPGPVNSILTMIFGGEKTKIRQLAKQECVEGYSKGVSLISLLRKTERTAP